MNFNKYIFKVIPNNCHDSTHPYPELEQMIFDYLDPLTDYKLMLLVNKYYCDLFGKNRLYIELKTISVEKNNIYCYYRECCYCVKKSVNKIHCHFINACKNGYILTIKFLLENFKINIHIDDDYAFRLACENGHTETVKYLFSLDNKINIHAVNNDAFVKACMNNHLDIAKYLVSLMNKEVQMESSNQTKSLNISDYDMRNLLYIACQTGNLPLAEFIFSLDNGIVSKCAEANLLKYSIYNGHINIARWLVSLPEEKINHKLFYETFKYIDSIYYLIVRGLRFGILLGWL